MPNLQKNEEFWYEWLKKYKSFQGLWNKESNSSPSYKQEAWSELIKMAQAVNAKASLDYLRTRLRHFIYNYKQDEIKVKIAKANGINYEPTSRYFKILRSIYSKADSKEKQLTPSMDSNLSNNELDRDNQLFWRKVLRAYVSSKCLWDENKKAYTNEERKKAWLKLTKLVQTQIPKVGVHFVKGRINSCRSVYRRELRRLEEARKIGRDYKTTLYYFDILQQLYEKKYLVSDQNDASAEENWAEENVIEDSNDELSQTNYTTTLIGDKKLWRKVLKKYVSFACLWDFENRALYSNQQRIAAWHELLNFVKKSNDKVDLPYLKSRISHFRSSHARELKRIAKASKQKGVECKSKLFYCDILCAMNQKDVDLSIFSSDDSDNDELMTFVEGTSQNLEKELNERGYFYAPLQLIPSDTYRRIWLELITKYVAYKCLWDTKNRDNYKDYERDYAWQQLLYIARKEKNDADLAYVRYRVRNMRTSYIRQFKKAKEMREKGKDFEITLFYFNALSPIYQKGFPFLSYDESKGIYTRDNSITNEYVLNPANSTYFPEDEEDDMKYESEEQDYKVSEDSADNTFFPEHENEESKDFQTDDEEEEEKQDDLISDTELKNDDILIEYIEEDLNNVKATLSLQEEELDIKEEEMDFKESNKNEISETDFDNTNNNLKTSALRNINKFNTFAERIALHLESMENDQYLFAEKLISDVCISGRQRELTKQSRLDLKKNVNMY